MFLLPPGCRMLVFSIFDRSQVDLVTYQASILCWSRVIKIEIGHRDWSDEDRDWCSSSMHVSNMDEILSPRRLSPTWSSGNDTSIRMLYL